MRAALADSAAGPQVLDELATYTVAVNQSLAVLSRAGTSGAELRKVVRLTCTTVAVMRTRPTPGPSGGMGRT